MESLALFIWENAIVKAPTGIALAVEFLCLILGGVYFKTRLDGIEKAHSALIEQKVKMHKEDRDAMQALRNDLELHQDETSKNYAKLSDVNAVWKEITNMRDNMQTGFASVNAQLTQISAAIIAAVGRK